MFNCNHSFSLWNVVKKKWEFLFDEVTWQYNYKLLRVLFLFENMICFLCVFLNRKTKYKQQTQWREQLYMEEIKNHVDFTYLVNMLLATVCIPVYPDYHKHGNNSAYDNRSGKREIYFIERKICENAWNIAYVSFQHQELDFNFLNACLRPRVCVYVCTY